MKLIKGMKNRIRKWQRANTVITVLVMLIGFGVISCKDDVLKYDNEEPEWLGSSIYAYLSENENFTTYVKLIDDTKDYKEILSRTGSKTLFVADDEAFERFFQNNPWGRSSYDELTLTEKKLIVKFGMIDNAYLIETLSNYNVDGNLVYGSALRRSTASDPVDTVGFDAGADLPSVGLISASWDDFRAKGIKIVKDNSSAPIVYFFEKMLKTKGISNADFKVITGEDRTDNDAHVFNIPVVERDIVCKNGYIHVLNEVMVPQDNLAEHVHKNGNTNIFSRLLDRFSLPLIDLDLSETYNLKHGTTDTIYTKHYNSKNKYITSIYGSPISEDLRLNFSPGSNIYYSGTALQSDMGTILLPTDEAMNDYWENGTGRILAERYGSWDKVPDDIVALFLNRHLRSSFNASVPGEFDEMKDAENSEIPISKGDVVSSYVGVNGVAYHTNTTYPPDDYVSVYAPVLFGEKAQVFNWAVRKNEFRLYLNSLENTYSFFVPSDDYFDRYVDPIAYAKDVQGALKYYYNEETGTVNATVYSYDVATGTIGDSISTIANEAFLSNRLLDLIDNHIVIGDVETGENYYFTKENNVLKVTGSGTGLKVQGGEDVAENTDINVLDVYAQENGNTYLIDKPIQTPLRSVYKVLSQTPQFSKFFELLNGFPSTSNSVVFVRKTNYYGIDYNIRFFNTFNYTIYVPTNDAMEKALSAGVIKSWEQINAIENVPERLAEIEKMELFLRYHFQDNSVFVGGPVVDGLYQSCTINNDKELDETRFRTYKNKYFKLAVEQDGSDLFLTTETLVDEESTAKVVKDEGLYNIMARDYVFNDNPSGFDEIDGTGSGSKSFTSSRIITSSTAVIHQIDNVLKFE